MFEQYQKSAEGPEDIFANVEQEEPIESVIRPRGVLKHGDSPAWQPGQGVFGEQEGGRVNPGAEAIQFQRAHEDSRAPSHPRVLGRGRQIVFFILLVVILGVGAGAAAFFLSRTPKAPATNQSIREGLQNQSLPQGPHMNTNQPPTVPINSCGDGQCAQSETPLSCPQDCGVPQPPAPIRDADQDGLTEEDERAFGTSDNFSDSDFDGLSDWDEVRVYQTKPLSPDSDDDGYIDGHEVKSGYNPNGPGTLGETLK